MRQLGPTAAVAPAVGQATALAIVGSVGEEVGPVMGEIVDAEHLTKVVHQAELLAIAPDHDC